jgi:hypothetical protein
MPSIVITGRSPMCEIGTMHERVATPSDVHRARAARADAATKLRSRHLQIFTQHPEQWRRGIDVHFSPLSVYG